MMTFVRLLLIYHYHITHAVSSGHNKEFVDTNVNFTIQAFIANTLINLFPAFLHPYVVCFLFLRLLKLTKYVDSSVLICRLGIRR